MSTTEIACFSTPEQAGLRVETISFDQIPQQTRLFLDYLRDPVALRRFYPEAVRAHYEVSERRERVLANYKTDRAAVCDALQRMNRGWGASEKTLANIRQLREADCIANRGHNLVWPSWNNTNVKRRRMPGPTQPRWRRVVLLCDVSHSDR